MKTIFADTGYWIAILNPADDLRNKAISVSNALEPFQILTSEMVFTEVLNSFSKRESAFRKAVAKFAKQSFKNPKIEVVPQNHDLFHQSLDLYEQRSDKGWSHTDCASFCIMQQRNILEALTHDRHFEQAGFIALLRQSS
ncbi:type II toxin-antitoxin system VapC family toxin [Phormidesmis sp. 146-12]